jgi:hypothetical protein
MSAVTFRIVLKRSGIVSTAFRMKMASTGIPAAR